MADNAQSIMMYFGEGIFKDVSGNIFNLHVSKVIERTGHLWDYRYSGAGPDVHRHGSQLGNDPSIDLSTYSGAVDPIFGPGCRIQPNNGYACYAAPTGHGGPEGARKYDYVTLKPGHDEYVYLDVGFWGGAAKRTFGLVCGPHVWLCNYGQRGGAPDPTDLPSSELYNFQREIGNFRVIQHATVAHDNSDAVERRIYMILPDMHMWPNPELLRNRRKEFFDAKELENLNDGIKSGKLIRNKDGLLDMPAKEGESFQDHADRMATWPEGRAAMKENAFSDIRKMSEEEQNHAFGSVAGADLVELLSALERARHNADAPYDVTLIHVGDLLEMWSPYHTWVGSKPFVYEIERLKLSDTANERVPKWIDMIYNYVHNKPALQALQNARCQQIYGNHDVYLGFDTWKRTNIGTMDRLRASRGFFSENLLWIEHGHRFDPSNRDGNWAWIDLSSPPGPLANTAANYYPEFRDWADRESKDDPAKNLYEKNVPYATIWYLLAHYAIVDKSIGLRLPPKFRIFCQGHTHVPVLLKVKVAWNKLDASGVKSGEEEVMKEEQRREQGARDGSYNPITPEEELRLLEWNREEIWSKRR